MRFLTASVALLLAVACDSGSASDTGEKKKPSIDELKSKAPPISADSVPKPKSLEEKKKLMAHDGSMLGGMPGGMPGGMGNPHSKMPSPHAGNSEAGPPREIKPSGKVRVEQVVDLAFSVPEEWEKRQPKSSMRLGEFVLPGPGGDAVLAIFRFPGGAGPVQANIDRWVNQFEQPDGSNSKEKAQISQATHGALKAITVDVTGTFGGKPDSRLLATIIEGHGDSFYFKATGPAKTLGIWAESWKGVEASMKPATAVAVK